MDLSISIALALQIRNKMSGEKSKTRNKLCHNQNITPTLRN